MKENPLALMEEAPLTMELLSPEERLKRAVGSADVLADVPARIDQELSLLRWEIQAGLHTESGNLAEETCALLTSRKTFLAPLVGEFGSVQIARLDANIGGMAPVGGEVSQILVNADQVAFGAYRDVRGILVHEKQHTDQVDLQVGDGPVLIIGTQEVTDEVVLLEGDTEKTAIDVTGYDRNDRPPEVYGEGLTIAYAIQENHADLWNTVLTETGEVGDLQNAVWMDGVQEGSLSAEDIALQSERTGYEISENVLAAIASVAAATRDQYLHGPRTEQPVIAV